MKPLLAHTYEPHRITYPCHVQPKLNGIRALYQNGRFQSRDEVPFPPGLLDHLAKPLLQTFEPEVLLDGELYVHGWPLQRINAAVTPVRQVPTEDTLCVEYHIFDVVDYSKTFDQRFASKVLFSESNLKQVRTYIALHAQRADEHYANWVSQGYEGMMYRLGDCPYTVPKQGGLWCTPGQQRGTRFLSDKDNRCWHLLKRKDWQDDDFFCVGTEEGEGKYKDMVGALVCQLNNSSQRFSVSGGLTDAQRAKYFDHPELVLGKKIKVKYLVLSEAGIPLNPTILLIS